MFKDKKDLKNLIILISLFLIIIFFLTKNQYLYGSVLDWESQHFSFADYFRTLFYQTKNLFPSFAFNLGAGQNIYNFSYYGLFNPWVLLSYFFPFIKMSTFMIITSILSVILTIILFYKWLRSHNFNYLLSFIGTFMLLLSAPIILHSHRHIMFVNYFPFLILALFSIDKYFQTGQKFNLIISIFLIILCSYYFSIPCIISIIIYGIYIFLKQNNHFKFSLFIKEGFKFLLPIIIGIASSAVLILPTLATILNGRSETLNNYSFLSLIIPKLSFENLLYSSYSIGLTSIFIIALIYNIIKKSKENRFLSITLIVICFVPLINYCLNGTLYLYGKVFIPLLPLSIYLILIFLEDLFAHKVSLKKLLIPTFIITFILYFYNYNNYNVYLLDLLFVILGLTIYHFKNLKWPLVSILFITSFITCLNTNINDELMLIKDYNYAYNEDITTLFKDINDSPFYRSSSLINPLVTINKVYDPAYYNTSLYSSTYNSYYQDFYTQTFANEIKHRNYLILNAVNNPLFNMYMGVKYFVSDQDNLNDYSLIKTLNNYHLYENKEAYPLGYVNPQTLNIETYQKLTYPYNIEALLKYTITNDSLNKEIKSTLKKYSLPLNNLDLTKLSLKKSGDSTKIKAIDKVKLTLPLDEPVEDYLLIRLTMNYESTCSFGDTSITINGIKNTLTCRSWKYKNQNYTFDYVLTSPTKLDITISPGTFVITNIESYTLDKASIKEVQNNFEVFNINKAKTKGDIIEGDITTLGGYLNLSIPYDSNFTVYVDNEITPYELVDTAFMGLKLSKGTHHLKIVYQAQGQKFGLGISLIGILTTIMIALIERKKVKKCKKI